MRIVLPSSSIKLSPSRSRLVICAFPWNEQFRTGLPLVDQQHQRLIEILNRLVYEFSTTPEVPLSHLHQSLNELVDYTLYHFQTEESIWGHYLPNDELEQRHTADHERFRLKIAQVQGELKSQQSAAEAQRLVLDQMIPFLIRWLAYHILEQDRFIGCVVQRMEEGEERSAAVAYAEREVHHNKGFYVDFIISTFLAFSDNAIELARETQSHTLTQQEVRKTRALMNALTDSTDDLIWSVSIGDFSLTTFNQGLVRFYLKFTHQEHLALGAEERLRTLLEQFVAKWRNYYVEVLQEGSYCIEYEDQSLYRTLLLTFNPITTDEHFHGISVFGKDITDQKHLMELASRTALHDALTDLPNRRLLQDRLQQCLASSNRSRRFGALLVLDIDDFKTINDALGHDVGDLLLVEVVYRVSQFIRAGDTFSRMGDDEFCILLNELSSTEQTAINIVQSIAEKVLVAFRTTFEINGHQLNCTCSIGTKLFQGGDQSTRELLQHAESAMFRAKVDGKDTVRFYDSTMQAYLISRLAIESGLRSALPDQLKVYYQVQMNRDGKPAGAEALLRWKHPAQGYISPEIFIPFAEESGMIIPIGTWVMRQVCQQLAAWRNDPVLQTIPVSVNVSVRQFNHPDFVATVEGILDETQAPGKRLKIELTESLMVEHPEEVRAKMLLLKEHGVSFALDDFGIGYSSLSTLSRLPLDQIKIDRAFVIDVLTNQTNASIARMITSLCNALGLMVVAEGVETLSQMRVLIDMGCHAYQGYLFSEPVGLERFRQIVATASNSAQNFFP